MPVVQVHQPVLQPMVQPAIQQVPISNPIIQPQQVYAFQPPGNNLNVVQPNGGNYNPMNYGQPPCPYPQYRQVYQPYSNPSGNAPSPQPPVGVPIHNNSMGYSRQVAPLVANSYEFEHTPKTVICRSCRKSVLTKVTYDVEAETGCIMAVLFCVFFPVTCLPLCIDRCKTAIHRCPSCGVRLGDAKPFS